MDSEDPPDSLDAKINHYWDKEYPGRTIEIIKSVPMNFGEHRMGLTIHFRIEGDK